MKNLLLTGTTGMLGRKIFEELIEVDQIYLTTTSRSPFNKSSQHIKIDLSDESAVHELFKSYPFDIVIHCAAITDIEYCKNYPEKARALHVNATRIICHYVPKVYYISTDSVFDGVKGNYAEDHPPRPINTYAKTKYEGELEVLKEAEFPYIIRTNIFGYNTPMKNSLFEWAYKSLANGEVLNGFENVYFNPVYTGCLADMLKELLFIDLKPGIYHYGCMPALSKFDFIKNIIQVFKFNEEQVRPVKLEPSQFRAPRPMNTTLNVDKIKNSNIQVPSCLEGLEKIKEDIENEHRQKSI